MKVNRVCSNALLLQIQYFTVLVPDLCVLGDKRSSTLVKAQGQEFDAYGILLSSVMLSAISNPCNC